MLCAAAHNTYIRTWEGWLYLATVIDIASRRVVGFAMADHLRTELIADALGNAVAARGPAPGVFFHSDRGCQDGFKGCISSLRPVPSKQFPTSTWLYRTHPGSVALVDRCAWQSTLTQAIG